ANVVDRKVAPVEAPEDLVGRLVGLAVLQGSQDRRVVVGQLRAVGGEVVHDLAELLSDDGPRVHSDQRRGRWIDEGDLRVRVDPKMPSPAAWRISAVCAN